MLRANSLRLKGQIRQVKISHWLQNQLATDDLYSFNSGEVKKRETQIRSEELLGVQTNLALMRMKKTLCGKYGT